MKRLLITEEDKRHILSLYNLVEDFKSQKKKFIEQGYDEEIVDKYLTDFREIKDKKFKELEKADLEGLNVEKGPGRYDIDRYKTFKELELVVDFMAGQRKFGSANFEDIKVDGKPVFEDEEVEIYYAPNKQSCIEYKGKKPYSWCISRTDSSNMFMRYRMNVDKPSFYFVKRKNATKQEFDYWNTSGDDFIGNFRDKWHFFVVQVLKNGDYIVSSAMNDGDFEKTWQEIEEIAPELKGKQVYFQPKPLKKDEIEKYERYKKGFSDEEFIKLPYVEKEYYIDSVVDIKNKLTNKQFSYLPDDLKNKYINLGLELSDNQIEQIKGVKKLFTRFLDVNNQIFGKNLQERGTHFLNRLHLLYSPNSSRIKYLNEKNKEIFNSQIEKNINKSFEKISNFFDDNYWSDGLNYLSLLNQVLHYAKIGQRDESTPFVFYLMNYIPKSKLVEKIKNRKFLVYLFFLSMLESKDTMIDFMKYLGVDYKKLYSSFIEEEMKLYDKYF